MQLKEKPLVECIFEMRWGTKPLAQPFWTDPHYPLLVGRLQERLQADFPVNESPLPPGMVEPPAYLPQYRFRAVPNGWPLVQIGPGVLTVNETAGYTWKTFADMAASSVSRFFEAYPSEAKPDIESLTLRYIDATAIGDESIFAFLRSKMKVHVELPATLFAGNGVSEAPLLFGMDTYFRAEKPPGLAQLRFGLDAADKAKRRIVWETNLISGGEDVPRNFRESPLEWLCAAHDVTDDWFFKMIDGDLLGRFKGGR